MKTSKAIAIGIGLVALFSASTAYAFNSSIGSPNYFYAPSNVITPLPGFTTSWSGGGVTSIANGGTNNTSQTTNGVNYFDGTHITSGSLLTTDGAGNLLIDGNATTTTLVVGTSTELTQNANSYLQVQLQNSNDTEVETLSPTGATAPEADFVDEVYPTSGGGRYVDWDNENRPLSDFADITEGTFGGAVPAPFAIFINAITTFLGFPNGTDAIGVQATSSVDLSSQLQIASSTAPRVLEVDSSPGTHLFNVNSNGDVGVASTTPSYLFTAAGSSYYAAFDGTNLGVSANGSSVIGTGGVELVGAASGNKAVGSLILVGPGGVMPGGVTPPSSNINFGIGVTSSSNRTINIGNFGSGNAVVLCGGMAIGGTGICQFGNGTSTPWGLLAIAGQTGQTGPLLEVSTSTPNATTTAFAVANSGAVGVASTTFPSFAGVLALGKNPYTSNSSTTIDVSGKFQINTLNAAGSNVCIFVAGTTLTVGSGTCTN